MNELLEKYGWVETELRKVRIRSISTYVFAAVVVGIVLYFSFTFVLKSRDVIYVVDQGSTAAAVMTDNKAHRSLEVEDHLVRFHELMFTLSPDKESIDRRLETAFGMSDRSVYDYVRTEEEKDYYHRLVAGNISQEFLVDSVRFNLTSYPYPAVCYGKVQVVRESVITRYRFVSTCQLREVSRSTDNPHGLLIEKFRVEAYEALGSRRRK